MTSTLIRWLLATEGTRGSRVRCLHSNHGGEFRSGVLAGFCGEQKNGVAERRIGLVMDIACTSMIHAQVSLTSLWTRSPDVGSAFHVWGYLALVRDTSADKLSARAIPCVFLGFPAGSPDYSFYHLPLHQFLDSRDVRFDKSVSYYTRYPCRGLPVPPPPLFLTPSLPPVPAPPVPPPPPGPAPSVAFSTSGTGYCGLGWCWSWRCSHCGTRSRGARSRGAGVGGAGVGGAGAGGASSGGVGAGGSGTRGASSGGAGAGGADIGGASSGGAGAGGFGTGGASSGGVGARGSGTGGASYGGAGAGGAGAVGAGIEETGAGGSPTVAPTSPPHCHC
ncbi:unnamed protein product [Closterium sp. NIES-54]